MKMSRQNYYKERRLRTRRSIDEEFVVALVKRVRQVQPQLGVRKLLHILQDEFKEGGVAIGRDRLFGVLRQHKLLIAKKSFRPRTTQSRHGFRIYDNLLKDMALTSPGQAVVSDITYIRTDEGFMYLALIMDAYSRAIVGYDCSDRLESQGALRALGMVVARGRLQDGCVHHSDRGIQYCCSGYVGMLRRHKFGISMTQENHCYENASAERLNGILKQEYGLGGRFLSKAAAQRSVIEAVGLYNWRRPHQALGYRVPMAVHEAA
jgi:transposase InsO family protein